MMDRVTLSEMQQADIPFLIDLWHDPEVMRYADELPWLRGWSKSDDRQLAWETHQKRRAELGNDYSQLILRLGNTRIGESFFVRLEEGFTFGRWKKSEGLKCLFGDIKLAPPYWGRGLGTEGMRNVVRFAFTQTDCGLLVVPPHRLNPAAIRVYEKAGFVHFTGMRSWRNHKIMELTRARYNERYQP